MRKNIWVFILVLAIAIPYFWLKFRPKPDVNELLKPIEINMDPDGSTTRRHILVDQINSLLSNQNCDSAERKIDSALNVTPKDNMLIDLKGQSLMCRGHARESLKWFHIAVQNDKFPRSLGHRAQAYTALKMFDSATADLKECANMNYDYNKDLGFIYEKAGLRDSAIKYFKLFLTDYPDSLRIKRVMLKLTNGG
jgi:tetratricopeptide (TPR) repeat protein